VGCSWAVAGLCPAVSGQAKTFAPLVAVKGIACPLRVGNARGSGNHVGSIVLLLALDTATESCSAAVCEDGATLARRFERLQRGQAERLVPMIEEVMDEAQRTYRALDGIVATVGPGSFTGVRVGLATARGLALAADLPLIGISTLEALAASVPPAERQGRTVLAAIDALRGQIYAQWFAEDSRPLSPPMADRAAVVLSRHDSAAITVVGSGAAAVERALCPGGASFERSAAPEWPEAATMARHIWARAITQGGLDRLDGKEIRPLYLREPGVILPGKLGGVAAP